MRAIWSADKPAVPTLSPFIQPAKQRTRVGGRGCQQIGQNCGRRPAQRFLTTHTASVGLGRAQGVQPGVGIQLAHIANTQADDLRAPAAAATTSQQQGSITNTSHTDVAGGQQCLQRLEHDRSFLTHRYTLTC